MHIDWQPDNIASENFDIDDILLCESGKLNLPGAPALEPAGQVHAATEGSL
jgi:hypothetical protein